MSDRDLTPLRELVEAVVEEAESATLRYGSMRSSHEGYGVLVEEMAELLDAIRGNNLVAMQLEAIQVAAVALRLADAVNDESFQQRSVK